MKVLIISHNPITTHGSMGKTMLTLFSAFSREEVAQLYIYPSLPDIDFCNAYFRMTDKDVLKSYYTFSVKGREIAKDEIRAGETLFEDGRDEGLYRNRKNKTPLRMLLRDTMWRFSHWLNKPLCSFIERERPDVLFVAPGAAKFLYRIAEKIAKRYGLPFVTYIGDDCYFMEPSEGFLGKRQSRALQKTIAHHMKTASAAITISTAIADRYHAHFGTETVTVMTGASFPIAEAPKERAVPRGITYLGGIRCNRYLSLAEIGEELDRMNERDGTAFTLDIYSEEKDESILSVLRAHTCVRLHGYVTGDDFRRVFHGADLLLHTEAFDEESMDLVKHSVSTKIADSLASGIPFLAYGPPSIASVSHLAAHGAALIATDRSALADWLHTAFYDADRRAACVENALLLAHTDHDPTENSRRVHRILEHAAKRD